MKSVMKTTMKSMRVCGSPALWGTRASLLVRKNPESRASCACQKGRVIQPNTLKRRLVFRALASKKRLGIGTSRCVSKIRSGSSTICCSTWRSSGSCATCCCSLRSSGTGSTVEEKEDSTFGEKPLQGLTVQEVLANMIKVGKEAVMAEIGSWTKEQLTGKKWNGLIGKWTFTVRYLLSQLPICEESIGGDGKVCKATWLDFVADQVVSGIFLWCKETAFFLRAGCIYLDEDDKSLANKHAGCGVGSVKPATATDSQNEKQEEKKDGHELGGGLGLVLPEMSSYNNPEPEDDGRICDQLMQSGHALTNNVDPELRTKLRGGMVAPMDDNNDWILVKRYKARKGKSFYGNVTINLAAVDATKEKHLFNTEDENADGTDLGSAEVPQDCASCNGSVVGTEDEDFQEKQHHNSEGADWAALGSVEDAPQDCSFSTESEDLIEDEELRGGAGGAASSTRKKQVGEAVQKMADILKDLQTQADPASNDDEVDVVLADFAKMIKGWEEKKPMKDDLKKQLEAMVKKLKGSTAGPQEKPEPSARQSFYAEFHKKAQEDLAERSAKGKGKGKGKGKTKTKADPGQLPKYDLRQAFPQMSISSWITIHKEIEEGRNPVGSVAICPNLTVVSEIQALSKAHGLDKEVLLIAKPDSTETDVEVKGFKKALLPFMGNLALVEAILATSTGKEPDFGGTKPIKAVGEHKSFKKLNVVSLRVMVVKSVLSKPNLERMQSDPSFALHLVECNKAHEELKTSGWSEQSEAFIGYLEIEKDKVDNILQLSGQGGVFISALRKNVIEWPNVSWRLPERHESMVQYHARIWHHAKQLGKPMAFRRGGGAAFGIVMPETEEDATIHSWSLTGSPRGWGPVSLREWLELQGWSVLDCTQPKRKDKPWTFRGRIAGQINTRSFAYEIPAKDDTEKAVYIHISRWEKRRKADEEVKPITGALWWSKNNSYADDPIEEDSITQTWPETGVPPTVVDSSPDGADGAEKMVEDDAMNGKNKTAPDGNSPPKKKSRQEKKPDVDKVVGGAPGPEINGTRTTVIDTGGKGDCGWRSLSFAVAGLNSTSATDESLVDRLGTLSKAMQAKVTTYLVNHRKLWEDSWAPETKTNTVMEDGPIPTTVAEYCEAIRRPQRWMDGMLLASAAVLQKINIVIWTKRNGSWCRIAVLKSGPDWKKAPTVPLILSRGHYVTLRLRKGGWPKEWVSDVTDETPCSQGIDTQYTDLNPILGRAGMLCTPHDKIRKRKQIDQEADQVDDLLRTCSSRCTSVAACRSVDCKVHRGDQAMQNIAADLDVSNLLRSCSPVRKASPGDQEVSANKKRIRAPNMRIVHNGSRKEWTCPICSVVLNVAKGDTIDRKAVQSHIRDTHRDLWLQNKEENAKKGKKNSDLGLRQLAWPVPFKKRNEDKAELPQFICPYCDLCLPRFEEPNPHKRRYLARISKKKHLAECAEAPVGIGLDKMHKDFAAKFSVKFFSSKRKTAAQKKVEEKPKKRIRAPNEKIKDVEDRKEWTCPICQQVLNLAKDGVIDRRDMQRHIQEGHPEHWAMNRAENAKYGKKKSNLGLRKLTWPVEFVKLDQKNIATKAQFICPYCELCLPHFEDELDQHKKKYLLELSKKHHIRCCEHAPEDVSLQTFQKDFALKYANTLVAANRAQQRFQVSKDKVQSVRQKGHEPVVIEFTDWPCKRMYGNRFLLCVKCRSILKLSSRSRRCCKGKCCTSLSPGINFWTEAEKRNQLDEFYQQLGMEDEEISKVRQALLDASSKQH